MTQLGYLLGRTIPAAMGPTQPLCNPGDDARNRPQREQAGIDLLLGTLKASDAPVVISAVGSARAVTAAFNCAPDLMRAKTRAVLLNAGSTSPARGEWNVDLDPAAYVRLWRSGLPIHWYPCATERGAFNPAHERGTYWKASHHELFDNLPDALRVRFAYGIVGSARDDVIGSLCDLGARAVWEHVLYSSRHVWATASLVMAAGRVPARTPGRLALRPNGWIRRTRALALEPHPIAVEVSGNAEVDWHLAGDATVARLFGRQAGAAFSTAMAEALNALLRAMKV